MTDQKVSPPPPPAVGARPARTVACRHCGHRQPFEAGHRCPQDDQILVVEKTAARFPDDRLLGSLLAGKYALIDVLGLGGFGAVYRGVQEPLGRPVAVKLVRPDAVGFDEMARARFFREAQILARLKDPHSVGIYDYGQTPEGILYLIQELIDGRTLSSVLRVCNRLDWALVVDIGSQVLSVLDEAHAAGILHRDVKPSNIMLSNRGNGVHTKLLDFGIAKILAGGPEHDLTRKGAIIGTPSFMPPERILQRVETPQADLYSLAVVLYSALAGRRPFEAVSDFEVLSGHVSGEVPPMPEAFGVPPLLEQVIRRALAKAPEDRFPDAGAMREALKGVRATIPPGSIVAEDPGETLETIGPPNFWTEPPTPSPATPLPLSKLPSDSQGVHPPVDIEAAIDKPMIVPLAAIQDGRATPPPLPPMSTPPAQLSPVEAEDSGGIHSSGIEPLMTPARPPVAPRGTPLPMNPSGGFPSARTPPPMSTPLPGMLAAMPSTPVPGAVTPMPHAFPAFPRATPFPGAMTPMPGTLAPLPGHISGALTPMPGGLGGSRGGVAGEDTLPPWQQPRWQVLVVLLLLFAVFVFWRYRLERNELDKIPIKPATVADTRAAGDPPALAAIRADVGAAAVAAKPDAARAAAAKPDAGAAKPAVAAKKADAGAPIDAPAVAAKPKPTPVAEKPKPAAAKPKPAADPPKPTPVAKPKPKPTAVATAPRRPVRPERATPRPKPAKPKPSRSAAAETAAAAAAADRYIREANNQLDKCHCEAARWNLTRLNNTLTQEPSLSNSHSGRAKDLKRKLRMQCDVMGMACNKAVP